MNNSELYDFIMLRMDRHGSDYFTPSEGSDVFMDSYHKWIRDKSKLAEVDESARRDLDGLTIQVNIGTQNKLNIRAIQPSLLHVLAVSGEFKFESQGRITTRRRPIAPIGHDRLSQVLSDPFHQPCDAFPLYSEYRSFGESLLMIHSDNPPEGVEIAYVKAPVRMDAANNPMGVIEVGEPQQMEIVDRVLRTLRSIIQDAQGYQIQVNEQQENN